MYKTYNFDINHHYYLQAHPTTAKIGHIKMVIERLYQSGAVFYSLAYTSKGCMLIYTCITITGSVSLPYPMHLWCFCDITNWVQLQPGAATLALVQSRPKLRAVFLKQKLPMYHMQKYLREATWCIWTGQISWRLLRTVKEWREIYCSTSHYVLKLKDNIVMTCRLHLWNLPLLYIVLI